MSSAHQTELSLSNKEYSIYSRQLILDNIGLLGQNRLKKSKVLIVGCGGLGCPSILYLAASGIGYIGIIDYDFIDISNLNRQILYNYQDINKLKTLCIKEKISCKNPFNKIIVHSYKLTKDNAIEVLKYYDIIIDGCDNFETRYMISKICYKLHKVHIYGGVHKFEGQCSVFNYKNDIKYSDLYPESLKLNNNSCNTNGILGIITGTIGILQATEVIKIIVGIGKIICSNIFIYNLLNNSHNTLKIYEKRIHTKTLAFSQKNNIVNIISTIQMQYIKIKTNKLPILLDIREPIEFSYKHIPKSINIPLSKLNNINYLKFLKKNHIQNILILHCSSHYKALIASNLLLKYKINHCILKQ